MPLFLDTDELRELTGKKARPAQARALADRGIPHEINDRGDVVVLRSYVEQRFGGAARAAVQGATGFATEPDFSVFERRA